jgi:hypothetical protein
MPSDVVPNDNELRPKAPYSELESIFGSLDPLPDESPDLDREIADAIAEELRRKESLRQAATTDD